MGGTQAILSSSSFQAKLLSCPEGKVVLLWLLFGAERPGVFTGKLFLSGKGMLLPCVSPFNGKPALHCEQCVCLQVILILMIFW